MRYKSWGAFLDEHCAILQVSRRQASLDMGFSTGYLEAIEKGRFGASKERCLIIAEYFQVDPNKVLALAGLYVPPEESSVIDEITAEAVNLSTFNQRFILQLIYCLKTMQLSNQQSLELPRYRIRIENNTVLIDLPMGADSEEIEQLLRQTLRLLT